MEETKELVETLKYFKEELDKMDLRNEVKEHMLMMFYERKIRDIEF
mgnify:CR=1 FL=1|jgi:hypothetical protein